MEYVTSAISKIWNKEPFEPFSSSQIQPDAKREHIGAPQISNLDSTRRMMITDKETSVYGWPNRGGMIVLKEATHMDIEYLGLSTISPPSHRPQRLRAKA